MSNYFNSNDIMVFPAGERADYRESRLFTEQNTVGLADRLSDVHSFVISPLVDTITDMSTEIELSIGGYYFKFKLSDLINIVTPDIVPGAYNYCKFSIQLNKVGDYYELAGTDDSGLYKGLSVSLITSKPDTLYETTSDHSHKWYVFTPLSIFKSYEINGGARCKIITHSVIAGKRLFGRINCGEFVLSSDIKN